MPALYQRPLTLAFSVSLCCVLCPNAGIFTPQAEILNGRAAMLGFGILLALEYKAGVPFF